MKVRSVRTAVLAGSLAISLFAAAARAQENVEEDAVAIKVCSEALRLVIEWGAGKVLDHYAGQPLEAKLNQLDAALHRKLSAPGTPPVDTKQLQATLNSVDNTRTLLFATQKQQLSLEQWKLQTGTALDSLRSAMAAQPASSQPLGQLHTFDLLHSRFAQAQDSATINHLVLSPTLSQMEATANEVKPLAQPAPAPPASECPPAQGARYLSQRDTWYALGGWWDEIEWVQQGGFKIWDSQARTYQRYPDPQFQFTRNLWQHLEQSPFSVCVDSTGRVFAYEWR